MAFKRPVRPKLTFDNQNNFFILFLDPKKILKMVSFIILILLVLIGNLIIKYIFSTLGPKNSQDPPGKQLALVLGHYDLVKKHSRNCPLGGWGRVSPVAHGLYPSKL